VGARERTSPCDGACLSILENTAWTSSVFFVINQLLPNLVLKSKDGIQLLAPNEMFVVVNEIISSLFESSVINASVLPRPRWIREANWAVQRLGREMVYCFAICSRSIKGRGRFCSSVLFGIAPVGNAEGAPLTEKTRRCFN
jgi:hypothetical protein